MLQVTVLPGNPKINEGKSRKDGRDYRIVEQAAFVQFPDGTSGAFTIQPPRDQPAYKPGNYTLADDSFYVKEGKLTFAPKLLPVGGGAK